MTDVWGESSALEVGGQIGWRLGPRWIWASRAEQEWVVSTRVGRWDDERSDAEVDRAPVIPSDVESQRFVFETAAARVTLSPALADRPVVSAPRIPLFVPPGEAARLYVGSPLWARVEVGEDRELLCEMPVRLHSDTWFGAVTGDGELCYSTRTRAALDLSNAPASAAAAVTPVLVRNLAEDTLPIDKLKLPVPYLPLYRSRERLWTAAVTLEHHAGNQRAALRVKEGPPPECADAELLTEARDRPDPGLLISAFSGLLHNVLPGDRE